MQRITGAKRFTGFNVQMAAKLTRQLIAQPEGQGIGLTVAIALGIVQEREVQIINLTGCYAFTGIEDTERQTILRGLVGIDIKRDFANLRGGDGVLNNHQQNSTQRLTIAVTFVVGRQMVVDQQLQTFALNHRQNFRHYFVNQILNREDGRRAFPEVVL